MLRLVLVALACAALAACTSTTTALEPQNRPLNAQQARIYVLRPGAWTYGATGADIKIDDKAVGEVANNSYLSIDRPPGRYKLTVRMPFDLGTSEHEFQAAGGRKYYFVINMKSTTVPITGGGFFTMSSPTTGRVVEQRSLFAQTYLAELDEATGAAALSQLKAP